MLVLSLMGSTKARGDIGEALVIAEAKKRGYQVAIPYGENWRYDLIVQRAGKLERIQCKYTKSDGARIIVKCRSTNNWIDIRYTEKDID